MNSAWKSLTPVELKTVMPRCPNPAGYAAFLDAAMREYHIDAPLRRAAFLAQLAHESGQLRYFEELASGEAYEGRKDLGNVKPGDGKRYKGRGPIQLTGRANYAAAGKALGVPLEADPGIAKRNDIAFRIAGWFWVSRGLNKLADAGDFDAITRRINGGLNGKAERDAYYALAKKTLGA